MNTYIVNRAGGAVPLNGEVSGTAWAGANALVIGCYPWYIRGEQQPTVARMLYDYAALYLQFQCADRHISAEPRQFNGAVCLDSCVEAFLMPLPQAHRRYVNLELNCCGQAKVGLGVDRYGRRLMPEDLVRRLSIATSCPGPSKEESPGDTGWWLAAALPLDAIGAFVGSTVAPKSGDLWRANFYRCGGKTESQCACWNPIPWPTPDYHRPEFFGDMRFA